MLIRKLIEAYWGTTPRDWEECTLDQIYLATAEIDALKAKWGGRVGVSPAAAQSRGLLPAGVRLYEGGKSRAAKLRDARLKREREAKEAARKSSPRGRRRRGRENGE